MATEHERRAKVGDVQERERPCEAAPAPPAVQAALWMQQTSGNQALARLLGRAPRTLARFNPEFIYGPGDAGIQKGSVTYDENEKDLDECQKAAERVIEEDLGGIEALWLDTSINSTGDWAHVVYSFMEERYALEGIDESVVADAIEAIKDDHRARELKRVTFNLIYSQSDKNPWSPGNLADLLLEAGVYLDYREEKDGSLTGPDGPAVERIFETEGAYAVKKIEFDEAKNEELLDADDVVVLIDHHQNKHQHPEAQITKFGQYEGGKGTKFASHKDLEWHRTNTAETVKQTVLDAVNTKSVTQEKDWAPPKDAIDGIIYDLLISFDDATGKWVGSYHCNPVVSEFND